MKPGGAAESSKGGFGAARLRWLEGGTISASTDEEGETSTLASGPGSPKTGDPLLLRSADEQHFGPSSALVFALLATLSSLFTLTALLAELAVQIALSLTLLLALPQLTLLLLSLLEALSITFAFLRVLSPLLIM